MSKRKKASAVTVEAEPLCTCTCGKQVYVASDHSGIIHPEPQCKEFEGLDPVDFLAHVRRSMGIPDEVAHPPETAAPVAVVAIDQTIPEALCRAQAYRESLLRLGYSDDQIRLQVGIQMLDYQVAPGQVSVTVGLYVNEPASKPGGDFVITCGGIPRDWYDRFIAAWNTTTRDQRQANYEQYQPWPMIYELAEALARKEIFAPELEAVRAAYQLRHDPMSLLVAMSTEKDRN